MTTDPICGMTVDEATALSAERDGKTTYFCSEHCRQKFLAGKGSETPSAGSCCGGNKPPASAAEAACCEGKHGDLQHEHADASDSRSRSNQSHEDRHGHSHQDPAVTPPGNAKYFCPMCPGVESDKPGDCPKCGMALERNPSTLNPQPLPPFTPVRCILRSARIIPDTARSAEWLSNRSRLPPTRKRKARKPRT